ncbi:hypothetical protein CBL_20137 [Carabus blaptoides fortunei]
MRLLISGSGKGIDDSGDVHLLDGRIMKHFNAGGSYTFLGNSERGVQEVYLVKQVLRSKYMARFRQIWSSCLSGAFLSQTARWGEVLLHLEDSLIIDKSYVGVIQTPAELQQMTALIKKVEHDMPMEGYMTSSAFIYLHNSALRVVYYHLRYAYGIDAISVLPYIPDDVMTLSPWWTIPNAGFIGIIHFTPRNSSQQSTRT